ncbi:hypothetical protein L5515_007218 [Caenorhabditis briggsae]|uniref:Uncharacterized protein n=1 Tax=Caenorhabditis briggsae TaxID=6238 RepID=A0AAE9JLW4_CAEBR|nr:hypothetical protein L5515_007218 [Caenorhabditis briggsae]
MSSNKMLKEPEPHSFLLPSDYVNELIKITQQMAPHATQWQWNQFGLIARRIELSHQYYLNKAYSDMVELVNAPETSSSQKRVNEDPECPPKKRLRQEKDNNEVYSKKADKKVSNEDYIFKLQETIYQMSLAQQKLGRELNICQNTNVELNNELDIIQKQLIAEMEDRMEAKEGSLEAAIIELGVQLDKLNS